jgi:putative MFS transporter
MTNSIRPTSSAPTADGTRAAGKFERRIAVLSGAGMFLDGYDVTVIAVALPSLQRTWPMSGLVSGLVASSVIIGMFFGMAVGGRIADVIGRKRMYLLTLTGFVVFALVTAATMNVWQLIVFRFLLGLCIGSDYPVSSSIVAEFTRPRNRGRLIILLSVFWQAGAFFAFTLGAGLMSIGNSGWRWMLGAGAVIAFIVLLLRSRLPESPRWLRQHDRVDEAEKIENQLRTDHGIDLELAPDTKGETHGKWQELFSRPVIRTTFFCSAFWFASAVAYYGIQMYTPTILEPFSGDNEIISYLGSAFVALLGVIGASLGMLFTERIGRRKQIIVAFAGMAVCLTILGFLNSNSLLIITALLSIAILAANFGPQVLNNVYPTEMFPTRLRSSGAGFAGAMSRIGSILGVLVFPVMVEKMGFGPATLFFAGTSVFGLVVSLILAPNTSGKRLEELQREGGR